MILKQEGFEGQKAVIIPRKILNEQCDVHPVINQLYVTDIGYYPKAKGHFRERSDGCNENILIYVTKGKGYVQIKNESFEMGVGNFILIPAQTAHMYQADEKSPWSIYWLHFVGKLSEMVIELMVQQFKSYQGIVDVGNRRSDLFHELYLNLERGYSIENLCYVNMSLPHFLSSFIFNNRFLQVEIENRQDTVNSGINFMQQNIHKPLTLQEIANAVKLSASQFSSIFRHATGFPPIEYFNHLKMQKACQYLLFTDMRIKEISNHVGFDDPYYFSRLFSKIMGMPPVDYRTKRLI